MTFTATFDDRAPGQWSGQDWVVDCRGLVALGDSRSDSISTGGRPWLMRGLPARWCPRGGERQPMPSIAFDGPVIPARGAGRRQRRLSPPPAASWKCVQGPGSWMLAFACGTNGSRSVGGSSPSFRCCRSKSRKLARCHIGSTKTRSPFGRHRRLLRRCTQPSATHAIAYACPTAAPSDVRIASAGPSVVWVEHRRRRE